MKGKLGLVPACCGCCTWAKCSLAGMLRLFAPASLGQCYMAGSPTWQGWLLSLRFMRKGVLPGGYLPEASAEQQGVSQLLFRDFSHSGHFQVPRASSKYDIYSGPAVQHVLKTLLNSFSCGEVCLLRTTVT